MLKPGMMLGDRYEIIELVGSGGMSEVYKAKDHKLNRYVAVKVLKREFSDDRNFVSKFRVEAQSAAGLSHPNIVNVYDVGEDEGIYYIVMEFVEGITLKEYIMDHGRLSAEQALDFALQIASGIEVAHQNHTIHREYYCVEKRNTEGDGFRYCASSYLQYGSIQCHGKCSLYLTGTGKRRL